jgi:hypothetical protein
LVIGVLFKFQIACVDNLELQIDFLECGFNRFVYFDLKAFERFNRVVEEFMQLNRGVVLHDGLKIYYIVPIMLPQAFPIKAYKSIAFSAKVFLNILLAILAQAPK